MIWAYVVVSLLPLHLQLPEQTLPDVTFDTSQQCWDSVDAFMKKHKDDFGPGVAFTWRCGEET